MTVSFPLQAAALKEDDLLLLDFVLDHQRLATSITAYAHGNTTVVSLAETGGALEFPIVVDPVARTASGWFIRPERTFTLNMDGGFVEVEGRRIPFSPEEVFLHQDGIFVSVEALSKWFPVDLRYQSTLLSIDVVPRERLPVQERQARRDSAHQAYSIGPATLPFIDSPYRFIGPHAADIGLGYSIRRPVATGKPTTGLSYSALLSGDIAYMDSHIYLNGNHNDALSDARFSLSRDNLGLPLGLRYVEIGDIVPALVPGVSYSNVERGILIQGGGVVAGRDDLIVGDILNISGNALEGWDVELFQNGMRVGFQTVGTDGRYNFTNLDPLSGENKFELVFYGPAGERRTETVTRYSGLGMDQPGGVRYQFSASQKGEQLYTGSSTANQTMSDLGSLRLAAGVQVRVLPKLSLSGAWNNLMINGERLNYYSLGSSAAWNDITFSLGATSDPLTGTRWDGSVQLPAKAQIWGFDTRFSHSQYAQAVQADAGSTLNLTSRTGLTMSGPIGSTSALFSLFHNRELTRRSNSASAGFTTRVNKITFGNTLNYYQFGRGANGLSEPDQIDGNFFFSTRTNPLSIRGGLTYALQPDTKARQYFLDSNLSIAKDMTADFGLTYNPNTNLTRYSSGLTWQLPQVTLSPRISYDSNGDYSGFIYAALSLAPRPDRAGVMVSGQSLATSGVAAARVFLDNDASNSFSLGDEPLPNVTIRAPQAFRSAKTDEKGTAYLTGLSSERATDIMLDSNSLPNAQMSSTHAGNSVKPRPTAVKLIDFPVIPTGEIDGHVYSALAGKQTPLAGALVELRKDDGKLVAFKTSTHDGFFVFESIPYGSYSLNLAGDRRTKANQPGVNLNREKNLHSDIDIILGGKEMPTGSSAPVRAATPPQPVVPQPLAPTPIAGTPVTTPVPPPPAPLPRTVPKPADGRVVQLGAFANIDSAKAYRDKLLSLGLMQAEQIDIVTVDLGRHGLFHRVVATPIGGNAESLCSSLKAQRVECFTIDQ
ncbi:MAG: hypothetical protein B7Y41_02140 [Hydrogenophilales bacterium 28-61-23]|nr:MAG: hypothetical protein B7Y41_02140 [Hydrogenophilales bacterium 28-61-23]